MIDPLIVDGVPTSPMDLECPNGCGVPIVDGPPVQADNEWASALIADHLHMDCPVARTLDVAEATVALALNSAPPVTPVERGGSAPPR